ncbi:MAG: alpha/beta hydrolase [Balneolaceae bacterium]|nr:alpha/beta hydrolase [Balneolaceae bacterium]
MKLSFKTVFRTLWIIFAISFMIYLWAGFQAWDVPGDVLQSNGQIKFSETDDLISFNAAGSDSLQILFYPGGLTDPMAYTPLARDIAEEGYTIHIVKMPWRMAQRGYTKINELFDLDTPSSHFILAGHSQGAKMAAQYVYENPGIMQGLILMGSSHPRDINLSHMTIPTLKLYAEHDGLASPGEVLQNKPKLPANTELVLIEGGNHAQFGHLGNLFMDDKATISREEQQQAVLQHITQFLAERK